MNFSTDMASITKAKSTRKDKSMASEDLFNWTAAPCMKVNLKMETAWVGRGQLLVKATFTRVIHIIQLMRDLVSKSGRTETCMKEIGSYRAMKGKAPSQRKTVKNSQEFGKVEN